MKKVIIILMLSIVGFGQAQSENEKTETKRAVATYTGSSTAGYYFTNDLDQSSMLFSSIKPEVLKKYDLTKRTYIREKFRVYYKITMVKGKKEMTVFEMELLDYEEEEDDDIDGR